MRKLLVKLFNLLYIAAAGVSLYYMCTRPIFSATVHVSMDKERFSGLISKLFTKEESEEEERASYRLAYRSDDDPKISDYLNREKVEEYFPEGFKLDIKLEIPVKHAFDLNNTDLLDDLIHDNLYDIVDNVFNKVADPLEKMFKDLVKGFATNELRKQINEKITEYFGGNEEATEEEVAQVFDNVYALLDNNNGEPVTVEDLAKTILEGDKETGEGGVLDIINAHGGKYVLLKVVAQADIEADRTALPGTEKYYTIVEKEYVHNTEEFSEEKAYYERQLDDSFIKCATEEQFEADRTAAKDDQKYFTRDPQAYVHNEKEYSETEHYFKKVSEDVFEEYTELDLDKPNAENIAADIAAPEAEWKYFVKDKTTYTHNTEAYDSSVQYYEKEAYTDDDIDKDKITDAMVNSLEGIDGLVSYKYVEVPADTENLELLVTEDIAKPEEEKVYWIKSGEEYVRPTLYSPSETYYTREKVVNDIDTAMSALIESFLGGNSGDSRAILRADAEEEVQSEESQSATDKLKQTLKDYLYNMIPQNLTEKTGEVGQKAPYILLAVVALFALPWAWFALVTILRTLRKYKCWTRPGIIIWGALLQVVLGIVLTYGMKYLWPYLAERVEALKEYADSINFDIRTGCLIPSFVWLGVTVSAIPYWILRRPLKYRAKQLKLHDERARYERKRQRYLNSKEN